ncbi:hypothetical protein K9U40_13740 [Xanthobacter autotrophicus]|uniref:hypothetical protein n=1 Tax=Xanthobacter TaxID=279 RepID=UPI0024AACE2F|nr:hypothetical protein [Xanthobacter autotrophicus]MDI4665382.1 hypothetical protein [Xanthobacter autotrophicus]
MSDFYDNGAGRFGSAGSFGFGGGLGSIIVPTMAELLRPSRFRRLAIATAALDIPRRKLPDVIADSLYGYSGVILRADGSPYELPDIDDVFGNDGSFRWISAFTRFAVEPPRQAAQERVLPRLEVIDLYFQIKHPERARLIAR